MGGSWDTCCSAHANDSASLLVQLGGAAFHYVFLHGGDDMRLNSVDATHSIGDTAFRERGSAGTCDGGGFVHGIEKHVSRFWVRAEFANDLTCVGSNSAGA